ncbi:MAG TPA: glutamate--tRNA ligase [Polyangiales bacterium]|jgi:glutamyl-tRNA synthetase|nr:glutamate--tRNA ligase [Polyangiales bacterium]
MTEIRVRFAPSPTGYLHIGGARTALYNWLWARKQGGKFILRIEDTDRERSTQQSVQAIFDSLRWLGLDWDEGPDVGGAYGPYFQTERLDTYREFVTRLIAIRSAYRCYCTKEDLDRDRAAHKAKTGSEQGFRYPGTCRDLPDDPSRKHVVRFRAPESGSTAWDDLIKGRIEIQHSTLQDSVLMRGDGIPLYNLGAAADDAHMKISLVARGDDHVINTVPQILLMQALSLPVPQFAHLPMILAPSGEKLSKRHAAVAVTDYRDQGYLPDGVLNYLARLGWSHGDQELFTRNELIEKFGWEHVGETGARFDVKKFQYVQANQLRMLNAEALASLVSPFLARRGLSVASTDPKLMAAAPLIAPRATTLIDVADALDYFFREPIEIDPKAKAKFLTANNIALLREFNDVVSKIEPFATEPLEAAVKTWVEGKGIELKDVAQPARVALTGRSASPGLFEVMSVLGRELSLSRLRAVIG